MEGLIHSCVTDSRRNDLGWTSLQLSRKHHRQDGKDCEEKRAAEEEEEEDEGGGVQQPPLFLQYILPALAHLHWTAHGT